MKKFLGILLIMCLSLSTIARAATGDPPTTNAEFNIADDHVNDVAMFDAKINLDENLVILSFEAFSFGFTEAEICEKSTNYEEWVENRLFKRLDLGKRYYTYSWEAMFF